MKQSRLGALAALVSVFGVVVQYVPTLLIERWANALRFPELLPTFETVGTTVTIYSQLGMVVGPLLTVVLAIALGYSTGRHQDVVREHRRFIETVAIGSILPPVVVIGLLILGGFASLSLNLDSVLMTLGSFLSMIVKVPLLVVLGAFAGLTFAHLQHAKSPPGPPGETDTVTSSENGQHTSTDTRDEQAHSAD